MEDETLSAALTPYRMRMEVVFLTDQKYVNLTAIAIDSLAASFRRDTRGHDLAIHVLCVEVDDAGRQCLARTVAPYALDPENDQLVTLRCVEHVLEGNPQGKARWLQLVSLKMHLPTLLPELDRAIFLDSDIVVVGDLSPLWQTDLEGCWLGAVPCVLDSQGDLDNYNIFPIRFTKAVRPINAGVLLMDLKKMRAEGMSPKLADWQQAHFSKLKLPEQEAIAVNYPGQWKALAHGWNFRPYGEPYWAAASWPAFRDYLATRPAIVHYQSNVRPYDLEMDQPYFEDWLRSYQRVNPGLPLQRKRLSYFQFVFFEYPDGLCRSSNVLPSGLLRFGLMITLLGLLALPVALGRYLAYLRQPAAYRWRINRFLARPDGG